MMAPSRGSATICGYDVATQMALIRQSLGLCPQHNMLFSDMTVEEHLIFFAMLKGRSLAEAQNEALMIITKLNLWPKRRALADTLSGNEVSF